MGDQELDVRPLPKPDKHPAIFRAYAAVPVGQSLVLVNDHDPRHLRDEFEAEYPGGYAWEYLSRERGAWRILITKLASTPLPRVLGDSGALAAAPRDATGAIWKLQMRERDLDSNVIALAPGAVIERHAGPDADVLIHVLAGDGQLGTELSVVELRAGSLVWLPRRSLRQFTAGPDGLRYLTVHQRRQALTLATAPPRLTATAAPAAARPEPADTPGDRACWAGLVCQECGSVLSEGHRDSCSQHPQAAAPR